MKRRGRGRYRGGRRMKGRNRSKRLPRKYTMRRGGTKF